MKRLILAVVLCFVSIYSIIGNALPTPDVATHLTWDKMVDANGQPYAPGVVGGFYVYWKDITTQYANTRRKQVEGGEKTEMPISALPTIPDGKHQFTMTAYPSADPTKESGFAAEIEVIIKLGKYILELGLPTVPKNLKLK